MQKLELPSLMRDLKVLIVEECDKDIDSDSIGDHEQLIGGDLDLDSLDALQISLAVKDRWGVRIENGAEGRSALSSVSSLAQTILAEQGNRER